MGEMVAVWKNCRSENGHEKSMTENRCEKLESGKILGWKIGVKNSSQKMKKKLD